MSRRAAAAARDDGVSRGQIRRLKWLTTIAPALAVVLYEAAHDNLLRHPLPVPQGYLLVGLVVLALTYGFSELVFGIVERLETQALARSREVATLSAMAEERERLSRELHDGLAQLVAYLLVRIDTVSGLVATDRREAAMAELERLRGVADDLYADVRESITGLRTRVSDRGLLPVVREYLDEYEERHGIAVELHAERLPDRPSPMVEFQLLRIVQEALANVRKHADAKRAWVSFARSESDMLRVVVGDDGRGFDPTSLARAGREGYGLHTMGERAAGVGGSLRVESAPGDGTRIIVEVPVDRSAEEVTSGATEDTAR